MLSGIQGEIANCTYSIIYEYDGENTALERLSYSYLPCVYLPLTSEKSIKYSDILFVNSEKSFKIHTAYDNLQGKLYELISEEYLEEVKNVDIPNISVIPQSYFDERLPNGIYCVSISKNEEIVELLQWIIVEKNTLSGKILDIGNKPIQNATIKVEQKIADVFVDYDLESVNQEPIQLSDTNGNYGWILPEGTYRITVTHPDYNDITIETELTTDFNITLERKTKNKATPTTNTVSKNKNIEVILPDVPPINQKQCDFTDLENHSWAENAIKSLYEKEIITGISNNEFSPESNITRADFILMITRMLDLKSETNDNFSDVSADKYYHEAVSAAKVYGIVNGNDNKFYPEEFITRQDMFTIVYRLLKAQNITLESSNNADINNFADYSSISDYALDAIASLFKNNLVKGFNNNINPLNPTTRAETAVFIDRLISLLENK